MKEFERLLAADKTASKYSKVTVVRDANGKYSFEYLAQSATALPTTPVVNNAPVAKTGLDTKGVVGTGLTFTAGDLATDADGDALQLAGVLTANPTIATATISGTTLTVTPVASGTTTITVAVSDGKDSVNVVFNVNVFKGAVSPVTQTVAYVPTSDETAAVYKSKAITSSLTKDIKLTINADTQTVATTGLNSAADVANAINVAFGGITQYATVSGDQVVITSATKGTSSLVKVEEAVPSAGTDAELPANTINGKAAVTTPTKAKFAFDINAVPAEGEKVEVAGKTYVLPVVASETPGAFATRLQTAIAADTTNAYTATVSGVTITLEQRVAAPVTATPVVKIVK